MTVEGAWVWDRPGWDYSFELQGELGLIEFDPLRVTLDRDGSLVDATPQIARPIDWSLDPLSGHRYPRLPSDQLPLAVRGCDPKYPWAHNNLGLALRDKGDLDGAIAEYRESILLNPNINNTHNNLGLALEAKGEQHTH